MFTIRPGWALLLLPLAACGPGRLPDLGFGTAAGETGGATGPVASSSDGDGPGDGDGSTSSGWGESVGEEQDGDGDGEGSSGSSGSSGSTTSESTTGPGDGDGDPDSGDWTDGNDGNDTWGEPLDVTNEPCEPLAQDCFPTHKCVPFATQPNTSFLDANKCMPILGDKPWGEPCTLSSFSDAQDDCDGEGFCWNLEWVQGELHGICVPFCVGTPQDLMCPVGWGCSFSGALALCPKRCDPLLQDCIVDYGCYWAGTSFQCLASGPANNLDESCEKAWHCEPGQACVGKSLVPDCVGDGPSCCTPWCDIDDPACAAPTACVPFFAEGEVPVWLTNIGICIP